MVILFVILIILASVILSMIVLVQNPKGGGLSGNVFGVSSQFMGVKQTNDVLEKGTWIFAAVIGVLCIVSTIFIPANRLPKSQQQTPQTQQPATNPNGTAPTK
jgi:preprotein translocase subunit SecG